MAWERKGGRVVGVVSVKMRCLVGETVVSLLVTNAYWDPKVWEKSDLRARFGVVKECVVLRLVVWQSSGSISVQVSRAPEVCDNETQTSRDLTVRVRIRRPCLPAERNCRIRVDWLSHEGMPR